MPARQPDEERFGFRYPGGELELFAAAANWKAYLASQIRPYLEADVVEVGAGLGTTARMLCTSRQRSWLALEPDPELAALAAAGFDRSPLATPCTVRVGTIASLSPTERFSAVVYVDVLEHIEDDRGELARAASHLRSGGHLIVLAPAHQWLYSPFDRAIGHFRRYSASTLKAIGPPGLSIARERYLDAIGLCASAANRMLLRQGLPTAGQIAFWDKAMIPLSRLADPLCGFTVGKSVLTIWRA